MLLANCIPLRLILLCPIRRCRLLRFISIIIQNHSKISTSILMTSFVTSLTAYAYSNIGHDGLCTHSTAFECVQRPSTACEGLRTPLHAVDGLCTPSNAVDCMRLKAVDGGGENGPCKLTMLVSQHWEICIRLQTVCG